MTRRSLWTLCAVAALTTIATGAFADDEPPAPSASPALPALPAPAAPPPASPAPSSPPDAMPSAPEPSPTGRLAVPAPPPEAALAPPHLNVGGTLGVGSPVGWLGAGLSVRPSALFALSAGAGLGSRGLQVASMAHVYPIAPSPRVRLGFGAGISTGRFVTSSSWNLDLLWDRYFERAWFLNVQASAYAWTRGGSGVEPFLGYGVVLNDRDGACSGWRSTCSSFTGVFFVGLTVHHGFWL